MSDFLCVGYKGMADAIRDHKGECIFTPDQIRRRFSKELKENRVVFKLQINKGEPRRCCAWYSGLQAYLRAKGLGMIKNGHHESSIKNRPSRYVQSVGKNEGKNKH